jgi:hypothetical protein
MQITKPLLDRASRNCFLILSSSVRVSSGEFSTNSLIPERLQITVTHERVFEETGMTRVRNLSFFSANAIPLPVSPPRNIKFLALPPIRAIALEQLTPLPEASVRTFDARLTDPDTAWSKYITLWNEGLGQTTRISGMSWTYQKPLSIGTPTYVIPAKAGIQQSIFLDPGFRRDDS